MAGALVAGATSKTRRVRLNGVGGGPGLRGVPGCGQGLASRGIASRGRTVAMAVKSPRSIHLTVAHVRTRLADVKNSQ